MRDDQSHFIGTFLKVDSDEAREEEERQEDQEGGGEWRKKRRGWRRGERRGRAEAGETAEGVQEE